MNSQERARIVLKQAIFATEVVRAAGSISVIS
jgi:hypothetical protein